MKKRLLSGLLALCLIFSLLPVSAFADEVTASGTCGDDLTWTLQDGTLTISGTGDMEDYDWLYAPWYSDNDKIESVEIKNGVTSIGYHAFSNCRNLKKLTVSESVTSIRQNAFEYCSSLESVTIPASVTSIERNAFDECWSLDKVYYSGTMEQWGAIDVGVNNYYLLEADIYCEDGNITQPIYCGDNLTWAFEDGTLTISGTGDMFDYHGIDAPWFGKSRRIENVVLQGGVTSIGYYAFANCTNLKKATIPDGVTSIGEGAFAYCESLESINIPASVTNIDDWAFEDCWSLDEVHYLGTMEQWNAITIRVYNDRLLYAGIQCTDGNINGPYSCGENVTWLYEDGTLTISGTGEMYDYSWGGYAPWSGKKQKIENVVIESGVTSIGYSAFENCTNLRKLTIPVSVTTIGEEIIDYSCWGLDDVYYSGTVSQWNDITIGEYNWRLYDAEIHCTDDDIIPLRKCGDNLTWAFKDGVLTISGTGKMDDYYDGSSGPWGYKASLIEKIVVEDGVTSIGLAAFRSCENLKSVVLPASIKKINYSPFFECPALTDIEFVGTSAQWKQIRIMDCSDTLKSITVHCDDRDIRYATTWSLQDGTLTISGTGDMFDYDNFYDVPWYDESDEIKSVVFTEGVTSIGYCAFRYCTSIKSLTIPASVKSIGDYAFDSYAAYGYSALRQVNYSGTMEQWRAIDIGRHNDTLKRADVVCSNGTIIAPNYCGEDTTWTFENGVLTISGTGDMDGYFALDGGAIPWYFKRKLIEKIVIDEGVTSIGSAAFNGCTNLKSIEIPESLTYIGRNAFVYCDALTDINYAGTVAQWNEIYVADFHITKLPATIHCEDGDIRTSSYCGSNIRWTLEDGVLTISGSGDMYNYQEDSYTPWYDQAESITSIVIEDGVTSIGAFAFYNCKNITNIRIPDSVTVIQEQAFSSCSGLESITIPGSVTYIGDYAFSGCTGLEEVVISEGVERIGANAFSSCEVLESITLPSTIESLGRSYYSGEYAAVFTDCPKLKSIIVSEDNKAFSSDDGVLFSKDKSEIITYPAGKENTEYQIPNSVVTISYNAFMGCKKLQTVDIPDSVVKIKDKAFFACEGLKNIVIPNSVAAIGYEAFYGCSSLESITIPYTVTYIGENALGACGALKDIYYGGFASGWKELYPYTPDNVTVHFADPMDIQASGDCGWDVTWTLDKGVLTISGEGDMYDYGVYDRSEKAPWYYISEAVNKVVIEDGVTSIGCYAFANFAKLTEVTIPDSVTRLEMDAFQNCKSLKSVAIPENVYYIGYEVFYGCESLTEIKLPDGVTRIWGSVFAGCTNLVKFEVNETNPNYCTIDGVLYSKDKTTVVRFPTGKEAENYSVPNTVTNISYNAFSGCAGLKGISIPDSVVSIGSSAFADCINLTSANIPSGITEIEENVFSGCAKLESINIPEGVTTIRWGAFEDCDSLESVKLPNSASEVSNSAFSGKNLKAFIVNDDNPYYFTQDGVLFERIPAQDSLSDEYEEQFDMVRYPTGKTDESYTVPAFVRSIYAYAFSENTYIKSIIIPDGITGILDGTFGGCSNLESIVIPESVTFFEWSFSGCDSLKDLYYEGSEDQWDQIRKIWADPENVTVHYNYTDGHSGDCGDDTKWTLKDGVLTISGTGAMQDMGVSGTQPWESIAGLITSVVIEDGVTSIGENAFDCCNNLKTVIIPESVTDISYDAFAGCVGLESISVDVNNSVYCSVDGILFNKDKTILCTYPAGKPASEYTIPESVQTIGDYAFIDSKNLFTINIPESVTDIGYGTFRSCTKLENINIPSGVTMIKAYVFEGCENLKSITLPDGVTSIGYYTFGFCSKLESIVIPASVKTIIEAAFEDCSALERVYYKGTQEQWGQIDISYANECLTLAEIHYNHVDGRVHELIHHEAKAPTCTESGYEAYDTCTGCDYTTYKEIAKTAHQYVETVFAPTCTVKGYTTHTCSVCGDNYIDRYVDALGHARVHHDGKAATCTESGYEAYDTCSRCNYTTYKELAALGHDFGEWTVTTEPTCTEKGTETKSCSRCNETKTRDVDALGHNHVHHDGKAATCTKPGYEAYDTCSRCNYTTYKELAALGHDFGEWTVTTEPTCTEKGTETKSCSRCNETKTREVAALDHDYVGGSCSFCGEEDPDYIVAPVIKVTTSNGKPVISWNAVDGAAKYQVYRSTDGVNYSLLITTSKTKVTNTGAKAGTKYYYIVTAVKANGAVSDDSTAKSITCKPAAPTVSISRVSGKAKLSWGKVAGATKYYVYRSTDGTNYNLLSSTTKTAYTDSKSASGKKYYYRVKAVTVVNGKAIVSGFSNTKSIFTSLAKPTVKITTASGKPKLTWSKVTGADKYYIYRSTDGKTFKHFATTTKLSYTNTSAKKGTKYYYKVKAVYTANTNANSAFSTVVSIKATK